MENNSCIKIPNSKFEKRIAQIKQEIEEHRLSYEELLKRANVMFGGPKWSYCVTNQTIDYDEYINGQYIVGCNSQVEVKTENCTRNDTAYYIAEGPVKSLAIHEARLVSKKNALKTTLSSFGEEFSADKKKVLLVTKDVENMIQPEDLFTNEHNLIDANFDPNAISTPIVAPKELPPNKQIPTDKPKPTVVPNAPVVKKGAAEGSSLLSAPVAAQLFNKDDEDFIDLLKTEEEKRLERKRRQKEKQEEYRKLYIEKHTKK